MKEILGGELRGGYNRAKSDCFEIALKWLKKLLEAGGAMDFSSCAHAIINRWNKTNCLVSHTDQMDRYLPFTSLDKK